MKVLSFDTGSASLNLALMEDDRELGTLLLEPRDGVRQEGVSRLVPAIDSLLSECGCQKEELELLAVGIGPASFTGVRIGVVTARSLAQALNLPLVGVSRFQVIDCYLDKYCSDAAEPDAAGTKGRGIILDGGRGNLFVAPSEDLLEDSVARNWKTDASHYKVEEFAPRLKSSSLQWFVESSLLENEVLQGATPVDKRLLSIPEIENPATIQAEIALKQLISCNLVLDKFAFEGVKPLYLRGASITLKKNASKASSN